MYWLDNWGPNPMDGKTSADVGDNWDNMAYWQQQSNNTAANTSNIPQTATTTPANNTSSLNGGDLLGLVKQQYSLKGVANPDQVGLDYWTKQLQNNAYTGMDQFQNTFNAAYQGAGGTSVANPTTPTTPAATTPTAPTTPEWLKNLTFTPGTATVDPKTGKYYQANYDRTPNEGDSSWGNITGYTETDGSGAVGSQFQSYDAQGNPTVKGIQKKDPYIKNFLTALAGAATMGVAGTAMGAAGAAGAGGAAGTSLELGMGAAAGGYEGFIAETLAANAGLEGAAAATAATAAETAVKTAAAAGATTAVQQAIGKAVVAAVAAVAGTGTGGGSGGGSGTGGNIDLNSIIKALTGLYDKDKQEGASNDMLSWMREQQAKIDKLYAPGSDEYNYLMQSMERKDAAAGRNSQYGPRSVDLAAKIAQVKADNTSRLTQGLAGNYKDAFNQNASAGAGLSAAIGQLMSGGGTTSSIIKNLSSIIKDFGGTGGKALDLGGGIKMNPDGSIDVGNSGLQINGTQMTNKDIEDMINGGSFSDIAF